MQRELTRDYWRNLTRNQKKFWAKMSTMCDVTKFWRDLGGSACRKRGGIQRLYGRGTVPSGHENELLVTRKRRSVGNGCLAVMDARSDLELERCRRVPTDNCSNPKSGRQRGTSSGDSCLGVR